MENIIEYYYNLMINSIKKKDNNYIIKVKNNYFVLKEIDNIDNISDIYDLSKRLTINTIIPNKDNKLYTNINNKLYVLLLINRVSLLNINNISNMSNLNIIPISRLERNNWELLWANRIDFLEEYISQNNKKYPLIRESSDYFIGLAETAIAYLVNTKREIVKDSYLDRKVLTHIKLSNSLYDPFNIIFDHKARDISEYIKYSFFANNDNIYNELNEYFKYNYYSKYGLQVLYSRLLYPSFYFNIVDSIIMEKKKESSLNKIINLAQNYQNYLYNIYLYLSKYYNIPFPLWIKKNEDINPHL